jgi:hypothetical protein
MVAETAHAFPKAAVVYQTRDPAHDVSRLTSQQTDSLSL